jgi:hypothetical protein
MLTPVGDRRRFAAGLSGKDDRRVGRRIKIMSKIKMKSVKEEERSKVTWHQYRGHNGAIAALWTS